VTTTEIILGSLLAAGLVALAGYYAWRQKKTLESLRTDASAWSPEDREFARRQARRRLWCSALMVLFAALLVGWFFVESAKPPGVEDQEGPTPEQRAYAWQAAMYLTAALVVLFAIVTLAVLDMGAISRFAHRKRRQLDADRQAVLEEHLARFRRDRNGQQS
jgi:hypothetical protein